MLTAKCQIFPGQEAGRIPETGDGEMEPERTGRWMDPRCCSSLGSIARARVRSWMNCRELDELIALSPDG